MLPKVASLRVGERGHALNVSVSIPATVYKVRDQVPVTVRVPDVALAAKLIVIELVLAFIVAPEPLYAHV